MHLLVFFSLAGFFTDMQYCSGRYFVEAED